MHIHGKLKTEITEIIMEHYMMTNGHFMNSMHLRLKLLIFLLSGPASRFFSSQDTPAPCGSRPPFFGYEMKVSNPDNSVELWVIN